MVSIASGIGSTFNFNQQLANIQHREQEEYADEPAGQGPETRQQHRKMKMNRSGLAQEQKFDLIDFIHQRPHIWDQNSEGYRSNQSRQAAFNEVAQLLSNNEEVITRIQVQEEWGKLRYCFTRIVKKMLEEAPDGQITEEQLASISWAFFRRMDFLLDSILQQLHGPAQQQAMGMDGGADWAAASLLHQQENMHSFTDEHSPLKTKIRRRRRHHNNHNNANGDINELSRKSSHEFGAEEMVADDENSIIGIDNPRAGARNLGWGGAHSKKCSLRLKIRRAVGAAANFYLKNVIYLTKKEI